MYLLQKKEIGICTIGCGGKELEALIAVLQSLGAWFGQDHAVRDRDQILVACGGSKAKEAKGCLEALCFAGDMRWSKGLKENLLNKCSSRRKGCFRCIIGNTGVRVYTELERIWV